jgi:hypothetical protein
MRLPSEPKVVAVWCLVAAIGIAGLVIALAGIM